jgi:glycerophosphoryl diester phosphodiesterase
VIIYAHRGASAHARANTVEAYRLAVAAGADGIELDARLTRDGVLILEHEERAEPHLPPFIELDFAGLREQAPWVPTLDEAWEVIGPKMVLNIELKNRPDEADYDPTHRLARTVAAWVNETGEAHRILLSSFNYASLDEAKRLAPGAIPSRRRPMHVPRGTGRSTSGSKRRWRAAVSSSKRRPASTCSSTR